MPQFTVIFTTDIFSRILNHLTEEIMTKAELEDKVQELTKVNEEQAKTIEKLKAEPSTIPIFAAAKTFQEALEDADQRYPGEGLDSKAKQVKILATSFFNFLAKKDEEASEEAEKKKA